MLENSSNQELLAAWRDGNQSAATVLVRRYMVRLTALVRSRMASKLARRLDPEDIVLSAWRSFFVAVDRGRVAPPEDDDLWPVLVTFSLRKLARQTTRHRAGRRDVTAEREHNTTWEWQAAVAEGPSPAEAAALFEELEAVTQSLGPSDRDILVRTIQGATQPSIASELGIAERTVRRGLQRVRLAFQQRMGTEDADAIRLVRAAIAAQTTASRWDTFSQRSLTFQPGNPTFGFEDVRLLKMAGQGGFGKVYRSLLLTTGEVVAAKFLKKHFWKDRRATENLLMEYHIASSLSHPGIVRQRGWGLSQSGAPFLVMDWIDGPNLLTWIEDRPPSVREMVGCGLAIVDALAAAHGAGIVHGDLTLTNILKYNEHFLLTDFGFARSRAFKGRSFPGGTPGFLAPEQLSGAFGPITSRTDYYGLGCLLYALLTGQPPFRGRDIHETVSHVLSIDPAPPIISGASIPPRLRNLILKCLAKEAGSRPSSIGEIVGELRAIYHGEI